MNGTSGFQEVRLSTSRSPSYRFQHEQRRQFGTGSWPLHPIHDLIALSTEICTKREKVPDTVFMPQATLRRIGRRPIRELVAMGFGQLLPVKCVSGWSCS